VASSQTLSPVLYFGIGVSRLFAMMFIMALALTRCCSMHWSRVSAASLLVGTC